MSGTAGYVAKVDRSWIASPNFHGNVFIIWGDFDTDVVDDDSGLVIYTRPTISTSLESAVAWARRRHLTVKRIEIPETNKTAVVYGGVR